MRIHLFDGPIETTPAMLQFVDRHINASIGRFADRIDEVRVRLTDQNGPKGPGGPGGPGGRRGRRQPAGLSDARRAMLMGDKVCVMIASLRNGESVMAREVGVDHYTLIAAAANTLKRRLTRARERTKAGRKGDPRTIGDTPRRRTRDESGD